MTKMCFSLYPFLRGKLRRETPRPEFRLPGCKVLWCPSPPLRLKKGGKFKNEPSQ
uniref:Uncharacterized protein n=1 Tax=Anguilla anguilla TaxID=7936 RepID=A0A0E9R5R6_ANGAN